MATRRCCTCGESNRPRSTSRRDPARTAWRGSRPRYRCAVCSSPNDMPRVAGVDPGTVSFDLCVLQDGEPVVEQVFETGSLSEDSAPLLHALDRYGPYALVYGPSGYGLPLVAAADVGERELAEMVLVRPDETRADAGVGGMRSLLRALAGSEVPVIFGPGVIHLPTVPRHRTYNRIDLGTAAKGCAAACPVADQA